MLSNLNPESAESEYEYRSRGWKEVAWLCLDCGERNFVLLNRDIEESCVCPECQSNNGEII